MKRFALLVFVGILALGLWPGRRAVADIGPLQTLVVVNTADRESRALGAYYLEKHGIPPASHRCEVELPRVVGQNISLEAFERYVRAPIEKHLERHRLRGQIQLVVFCWRGPTRVNNDNSLSSAFFYGYKARPPEAKGPCVIAPDSRSAYYEADRAFSATAGYSPLGSPLAFVLSARTLDAAKAVVDRAVSGHAQAPEAAFALASSGDRDRAVRTSQFAAAAAQLRLLGVPPERILVSSQAPLSPPLPLASCSLGQAYFPSNWQDQAVVPTFVPGAICEHLTSCGGQLPDPCLHQAGVWDWFDRGATASYGTVSEPCNFTVKFPHARLASYVARGFTLAEALAMSVANPYQGLFAGDPLCAPYAAPPAVRITYPPQNTGVPDAPPLALHLDVQAHPRGLPAAYLDLYVDGIHFTPMARPMSPAGNEILLTVGDQTFRHTVGRGEDLEAAVQAFAFTLRTASSNRLQVSTSGDLLTLSTDGTEPLPISIEVQKGLGQAPYIGARILSGARTLPGSATPGGPTSLQTAAIQFHLGTARRYAVDYSVDLSFLPHGLHVLTIVARDGSALQTQGQASVSILRK